MSDGSLVFDTKLDSSGLSTGLGGIGKVAGATFAGVAAAAGAAATAVGVLAKSALDGYAAYEQLTGGVETLFKDSSDVVMQYADNAYKTAGMSANAYMETVTSFSASLIQSLGGDTAAAAKAADVAITDMSDNANKMGTDITMIQNAYNGFAKGNFTMLDNLKLGYGGTKEEMQRLLEDAQKISGIEYDISSFADVADAIHVIQTEIGITGTTAREASSTIEGSVASMKASWQNLVVGIADDNADLDALINQFVDSAVTAASNIIPRIEIILGGIGQLIETMLPVIMDMIPGIVNDVLPDLLTSGVAMVDSIITGIVENIDSLLDLAMDVVLQLVGVILDNLPAVIESGLQIILKLAEGIANALPELIPTVIDVILEIVHILTDPTNLSNLLDAALLIIVELAYGLMNAIPELVQAVSDIIINIADFLVDPRNLANILKAAVDVIIALGTGLVNAIPTLLKHLPKLWASIIENFRDVDWGQLGRDLVDGFKNGISRAWSSLKTWFKNLFGDLIGIAKEILGIASPSKKFKYIGEMCVAGFDDGVEDLVDGDAISKNINASVNTIAANTSSSRGSIAGGINQTININKEIGTPDELARTIRLESKYGLMRGVAFA